MVFLDHLFLTERIRGRVHDDVAVMRQLLRIDLVEWDADTKESPSDDPEDMIGRLPSFDPLSKKDRVNLIHGQKRPAVDEPGNQPSIWTKRPSVAKKDWKLSDIMFWSKEAM